MIGPKAADRPSFWPMEKEETGRQGAVLPCPSEGETSERAGLLLRRVGLSEDESKALLTAPVVRDPAAFLAAPMIPGLGSVEGGEIGRWWGGTKDDAAEPGLALGACAGAG